MTRLDANTVRLTNWEQVISDERENLLDQGYNILDAVKELKRRHIELNCSDHKEFVDWLSR